MRRELRTMGLTVATTGALAMTGALSAPAQVPDVTTDVGVFAPVLKIDAPLGFPDSLNIRSNPSTSIFLIEDRTDTNARLSEGPGCTGEFQQLEEFATCPSSSVGRFEVKLRDRDDFIDVGSVGLRPVHAELGLGSDVYSGSGSSLQSGNDTVIGDSGDDEIDAGVGSDKLFGDAGTDTLESSDGENDTVLCGIGFGDHVKADLKDAVGQDCEKVERAAVNEHPTVRIRRAVVLERTLRVSLICPANPSRRCRGRLTAKGGRRVALGRTSYRIRQRRSKRVTVPLGGAARRYLTGRRRRVVRITARERDRTGRPKTTLATFRLRR